MGKIIGREKQQKELKKLYEKQDPVFLAVYGRRRVGKTYLINEYFKNKFTFKHTGVSSTEFKNKTNEEMLEIELGFFADSLRKYGSKLDRKLTSWRDAFNELEKLITESKSEERKVVFIDEMPWLDTKGSLFISSFAHFWNDFGCTRDDLFLIICGSAATWVNNKLLKNKADLYKRVSHEIRLEPFNLKECEELLNKNGIKWRRYQITQTYMILGGIPFYLKYLDEDLTLEENIDELFFTKDAKLRTEFEELFKSTFDSPETIMKIVKMLSMNKIGLSRTEICNGLKKSSGNNITMALNALIESGFVLKYKSFKTEERSWQYKLVDPFCLFYLKFVENHQSIDEYFWSKNFLSPSIKAWQGNNFENICFNHIQQIKKKIGIEGLSSNESLWFSRGKDGEKGSQIDLIIERKDNIVDMCEAKLYSSEYSIDKDDYDKLVRHENALANSLSKRSIIHHVLITTFGLNKNIYSDIYKNVIVLDDLFE